MHKRRLKTLGDIRRWVADVANRMERGEVETGYARCAAYMASVMAGIVKDGELEQRVAELEKQMERKK